MSGSKTRIQASRDQRSKQQAVHSLELGEAATIAERQRALYAAQMGVVDTSLPRANLLYPDVPDSFLAEGESKESRMISALDANQKNACVATQRDAPSSVEMQMRLLQSGGFNSRQGEGPPSMSSQLLMGQLTDFTDGGQISDRMLANLAQSGRVADQLRARELATRMMMSQAGSADQMYSGSDMRARLLAQTYRDSTRGPQMDAAAILGRQRSSAGSSGISPNRMLNQATQPQQGMLPFGGQVGGTSETGFDASRGMLANALDNRDYRNSSLQQQPDIDRWSQGGSSLSQSHSQTNEAERLLQLYMLQQQQRDEAQQGSPKK
jgi:hypothetical protein